MDERGQIHELESGNRRSDGTPDPWFEAAAEYARQLGLVRGRAVLGLARHVEIKVAMRMHARCGSGSAARPCWSSSFTSCSPSPNYRP